MPNDVRHRMTIVGPDADVRAFVDRACAPRPRSGDEPGSPNYSDEARPAVPLSFHAIAPLPEAYSRLPYSPHGWQMEHDAWGVKWGAYNQSPPEVAEGQATYAFTCAWGLPYAFLERAAEAWPSLTFLVSYGGEGPTRGRVVYLHGVPIVTYPDPAESHPYPTLASVEGDEDRYLEAYGRAERHFLDTHDAWIADFVG